MSVWEILGGRLQTRQTLKVTVDTADPSIPLLKTITYFQKKKSGEIELITQIHWRTLKFAATNSHQAQIPPTKVSVTKSIHQGIDLTWFSSEPWVGCNCESSLVFPSAVGEGCPWHSYSHTGNLGLVGFFIATTFDLVLVTGTKQNQKKALRHCCFFHIHLKTEDRG